MSVRKMQFKFGYEPHNVKYCQQLYNNLKDIKPSNFERMRHMYLLTSDQNSAIMENQILVTADFSF